MSPNNRFTLLVKILSLKNSANLFYGFKSSKGISYIHVKLKYKAVEKSILKHNKIENYKKKSKIFTILFRIK